ncbi:MAG: phosphate acyltransferase PlsX [Oscillospiraceae bacterium]|nr:phosphate acyltransferase PlsX [Oscillospiraceae bacterium]MBQ7130188.1 phosphate acyltransferase PlsX [Oscillospiraceae bacterium]
MKIILDAMGGDLAPEAPVLGAIDAARAYGAEITLVGRGEAILEVMKKHGIETLPAGMEIAHADDVVDMHDDPGKVIHKRKNSSMVIGLRMLAEGQGDAFVSAGSTGALLSGATLIVKRVKGIRRAAMAPSMPTKAGHKVVICDCGANAECTPEFLLQFGLVASAYCKYTLGVKEPRVGLLNIGAEDSKGTQLQKDAYALLTKAREKGLLNFVGNVEARGVPLGEVDVVVCDGFNGNVLIKSIEGTAMFMGSLLKKMFKKNIISMLGALCVKSGIKDLMKLLDSREIGGTQFLGIKKPVIKCHGNSDPLAFRNGIRQAMTAAESNFTQQLEQDLAVLKEMTADD